MEYIYLKVLFHFNVNMVCFTWTQNIFRHLLNVWLFFFNRIIGQKECEGNIIHGCSVESIHDTETRLNFVACMIRDNSNPQEAFHRCSKEFTVDVETIQKCFSGLHGRELLKISGEATHALRPPVSFIPTVTLDGAQRRQATILRNLFEEICACLSESGLTPKACESI